MTTRAIDAVLGQPWAIMPEWLHMIAALAQRQFDAPVVAAMQSNRPRAGSSGVAVSNGVAVIGVIGPIFPRANMMTENSGATSLAQVQAQFRDALANSDVRAIVLNIDSPGGVSTGIGDFATEVAAARGHKPIVAVASGQMASAAYWIGAACSSIVASPTAMLGSIGVVMGMSKQVAPDQNGEMSFEIVSSNAPNKRPDPMDSAGRSSILSLLDGIEYQFIASIAQFRGVTQTAVKADFGQGGVMIGTAAVKAGMADRLGTLDSVVTGLAAASPVKSSNPRAAAAASSENASMSAPTTIAELTAAYPELIAQIRSEALASVSATAIAAARAEGLTAGAEAERARIAGIEALALPGHAKLIADMKADGTVTPEMAAIRIVKADQEARKGQHQAIADVETVTGRVAADGAATRTDQPKTTAAILADRSRTVEERCKTAWEGDEKIREEFGTVGAFTAYQAAVESGKVKVLTTKA